MHIRSSRNWVFGTALQLGALNLAALSLPSCRDGGPESSRAQSNPKVDTRSQSGAYPEAQLYEFKNLEIGSYRAIADKSLEQVLGEVGRGSLPRSEVLLMDALLRVGQENALSGLDLPFGIESADRMRGEMLDLTQVAAQRLQRRAASEGGRTLEAEEVIAELNLAIFEGGRRFTYDEDASQKLRECGQTVSLHAAWSRKGGNCEDLVGVYASVVDLLRHGGIELPIEVLVLPEHVMLLWRDPGSPSAVCIEATKAGALRSEQSVAWRYYVDLNALGGHFQSEGLFAVLACELENSISACIEADPMLAERYAECNSRLEKGSLFSLTSAANKWILLALHCKERRSEFGARAIEFLDQAITIFPGSISIRQMKALAHRMVAESCSDPVPELRAALDALDESLQGEKGWGLSDRIYSIRATRSIAACFLSQIAAQSGLQDDFERARSFINESLARDEWYGEKFEIMGDLYFGYYRASGTKRYLEEAILEYANQARYGKMEDRQRGNLKRGVAQLFHGDFDAAAIIFERLSEEAILDRDVADFAERAREICRLLRSSGSPIDGSAPLVAEAASREKYSSQARPASQGSLDSLLLRNPWEDLEEFVLMRARP